jgi:hypothetical protein
MSGGGARSGNGRDERENVGKREELITRGGVKSWEKEEVSAVPYQV